MALQITPHFSAKEIYDETIAKDWFIFQNEAFALGQKMTHYMQTYINRNRHRRGGTGNLARSIAFHPFTSAGIVSWGVGFIPELPPYWYVVNYGRMVTGELFIPAKGNFVPGSFEGNRPEPALRGGVEKFNYKDGSNFGMYPKSIIRPINYIQATQTRLDANLRALLLTLGRGK